MYPSYPINIRNMMVYIYIYPILKSDGMIFVISPVIC